MENVKKKQLMTEFRVGLLFLLVIAIIMVALFLIRSKTDLLEPQYQFEIMFPSVQGLKLGAPVQLAGVRIGEVVDIRFPENMKEQQVIVTVKVKEAVKNRIRHNAAIYIDSPSLLSEKNIQITFGTEESPVVQKGEVLEGLPGKP